MRFRSYASLIAIVGGLLAGPVAAQTGEALIRNLFIQLEDHWKDSGTRVVQGASFQNRLNSSSIQTDTVRLEGGQTYLIAGVCDESCSDVEVDVRDANNVIVGSNVLGDIVVLKNVRGGVYRIESLLPECWADRCLLEVRVYREVG